MVRPITDSHKDTFNKTAVHPLQSWEWGEFREKTGNRVERFGVFDGKKLTAALQLTIHPIPSTPYTIGALIKGPEPTKEILTFLSEYAKSQNMLFIKMEPNVPQGNSSKEIKKITHLLKEHGCREGKTLFTPTTFWIDLAKDEDDLMKNFSSKTRYNIRYAERNGVTVREDNSKEAFDSFIALMRETVTRQRFYAHSETYFRLMWEHLYNTPVTKGKPPLARLLTASYKKEILTAWVVFVWHDFLYYPYGASTDRHKNLMANNLMMWQAIRYGKRLGLKTFDLWGREEGKGFTRFKEGFHPQVVQFLGTWDLVTSPLYRPYRIAEQARWKLLRAKSRLTPPRF